jgi:hypothetical protein
MAGDLFHAVEEWEPVPGPAAHSVSPGRASTIYFFPARSFEELKDKPKGWNVNSMSGECSFAPANVN